MIDLMEGQVKNGFNVVSRTKRIYELQSETEEDMQMWIEVRCVGYWID